MDIQKCEMKDLVPKIFVETPVSDRDKAYIEEVTYGTERELVNIDDIISKGVKNWNLNRISKIDKAALRLAVYEIFNCDRYGGYSRGCRAALRWTFA
jgi:N utilization substance protein B